MKFYNLQYEPKNRVGKIFVIFLHSNRGGGGGVFGSFNSNF